MQRLLNRAPLTAEAIEVRPALLADHAAIHRFTENSQRVHFNLDWWSFDNWLYPDRPSDAIWLAFHQGDLIGLLLAPDDQSPIVWLRALALGNHYPADPVFSALLARARSDLLAHGTERLSVLAHPDWVDDLVRRHQFSPHNEIVTFRKSDRGLPDRLKPSAARLRPARPDDVPALVAIEHLAFEPSWWHSAASIAHILKTVSHFVVAEIDERVVGHAYSDVYGGQAHLIRLVVHPEFQRRGIGEQLLAASLRFQIEADAYPFTLNTQSDNGASQLLYRRYGYQLVGWPVRVMQYVLSDEQILPL